MTLRLLSILLCLLFVGPALAGDTLPPPPPREEVKEGSAKPEIITDEESNTVRILIDGKEILVIDETGVHVRGDLNYSGVITDTSGSAPNEP